MISNCFFSQRKIFCLVPVAAQRQWLLMCRFLRSKFSKHV